MESNRLKLCRISTNLQYQQAKSNCCLFCYRQIKVSKLYKILQSCSLCFLIHFDKNVQTVIGNWAQKLNCSGRKHTWHSLKVQFNLTFTIMFNSNFKFEARTSSTKPCLTFRSLSLHCSLVEWVPDTNKPICVQKWAIAIFFLSLLLLAKRIEFLFETFHSSIVILRLGNK